MSQAPGARARLLRPRRRPSTCSVTVPTAAAPAWELSVGRLWASAHVLVSWVSFQVPGGPLMSRAQALHPLLGARVLTSPQMMPGNPIPILGRGPLPYRPRGLHQPQVPALGLAAVWGGARWACLVLPGLRQAGIRPILPTRPAGRPARVWLLGWMALSGDPPALGAPLSPRSPARTECVRLCHHVRSVCRPLPAGLGQDVPQDLLPRRLCRATVWAPEFAETPWRPGRRLVSADHRHVASARGQEGVGSF